jgi:ProQ/FINO family
MTLLALNSAARERAQALLATSPVAVRFAAKKAKVEKTPAPAMPKPNLDDVLRLFSEKWPDCFSPPGWAPMRALKLHIHRDIVDQLPDLKPRIIASALNRYCSNPGYRRRLLVAGAVRYGLDGEPAGVITENEVPPKPDCSSATVIPTSSTVEESKAA